MSDRPTDGGELTPGEVYVSYSGRCRITATGQLTCVGADHGYHGVTFEAGEEHAFDCLQWKNKSGAIGTGFVIRTGDGDAYLMPHLFERVCEVIGEAGQRVAAVAVKPVAVEPVAVAPVSTPAFVVSKPVVQPTVKKQIKAKKSRPVQGSGLFEGE